eukprot:COSAG01_NODE_34599_length_545_cov_0.567265_2_plen_38_part_01
MMYCVSPLGNWALGADGGRWAGSAHWLMSIVGWPSAPS